MNLTSHSRDWEGFVSDPRKGEHILFWSDGTRRSESLVETFLRGGLERDDLVAIVLPAKELEAIAGRFQWQGFDVRRLVEDGRMLLAASETVAPRNPEECDRIPSLLSDLSFTAAVRAKAGLSILGKVAPIFFDRGEEEMASAIERKAQESRRATRILCLYDCRSLVLERLGAAYEIVSLHTATITALPEGRFLVEEIAS